MNQLTEFQKLAAIAALTKALTGSYFSISDFDAIAKLLGVTVGGPDYQALRTLHCVNYGDMGADLARQVRDKCCELLQLPLIPPETFEHKNAKPDRMRDGVLFWRR